MDALEFHFLVLYARNHQLMEMHYMFDRRVKLMFLPTASESTVVNCKNLVRILEGHRP
jgi:hypothetical protein